MSLSDHPLHATEKPTVALLDKWLSNAYNEIVEMKKKIESLEKSNLKKDEKIKKLEADVAKNVLSSDRWFSSLFKKNTNVETAIIAKVRQDFRESEMLEKNIILSGLDKEGEDLEAIKSRDKAEVDKVLAKLNLTRDHV